MLITWMATCKGLKLDYSLTSYTKINCKWIKNLNVKTEAIKPLENRRNTLWQGLSNVFLDISPQVREAKQKNKQVWLHQTKTLLHYEESYQQKEKAAYWLGRDLCKLCTW